ncbi:hypothetical protein FHL15_000365 [Xylaria flabelliformis]|uniref:Aminoglycoside phosphotransferase domain-containing protein n=1 Tax=Xylaria flabelliformis TaxID=2512241 RepID=A0A553IFP5_9PEZI|nr:hypothetical protein FHL15_000365 [Xylaria flabelliformis]
MESRSTTTQGANLIGVAQNHYWPMQIEAICAETGKIFTERIRISKPTKCLFLAGDGFLKWVGVNAGVFPGRWWNKDVSHLVFPPFPAGSWKVGQIRRSENGEVGFTKTLEIPLEGVNNAFVWHPTIIEFAEFELVSPFKNGFKEGTDGRLWHVKHLSFKEKSIFIKIDPFFYNWSKSNMEAETRVYQRVAGLGIAPEFLGHVTYRGIVIGFILKWIEGAKTTEKKDRSARLAAIKKLHALGITHGTAHRDNFLKIGDDIPIIDFEEARLDEQATDEHKYEDVRRIRNFKGDALPQTSIYNNEESVPESNNLFDPMVDDEICWSDDSTAGKSEPEDD